MTQREFYTAIVNGTINADIQAYAANAIAKLDERNASRKGKLTPSQKANAEVLPQVADFVRNREEATLVADVAEHFGFSTQKATGLLNLLVKDGTLTAEDVKVPKKGKRKAYTAA